MGDMWGIIDAGTIIAVLSIFTYLVRKDAKRDMLLTRLLHRCGLDEHGNEREGFERPSDTVRRVIREQTSDGTIQIDKHRGKGA